MPAELDPVKVNIALLSLGGLIYFYGLLSRYIKERLYLSAPILATLLGVIIGPIVLGIFDVQAWGQQEIIVEEFVRVASAVQLMSIALRLRSGYPFRHWRSIAVLLGPLLVAMWVISSGLVYWLMDVDFWVAVLIGAAITPTDPVLASTIVTGSFAEKRLPKRIRSLLSVESGLNHGFVHPFVFLPLLLLTKPTGDALFEWFAIIWLWDMGIAIVLGVGIGYTAGKLIRWAQRKKIVDKESTLAYVLGLSFMVLGAVKLMGSEGIVAVFMAGLGYDLVIQGSDRVEEENVQEALDIIVTVTTFSLFGLVIPWQEWLNIGWSGLFLILAILAFRRLPAFLLLNRFIPHTNGLKDALFMGWFGPIGVAAMLYSNLAAHRTGNHEVWHIASLVIAGSVVIHGVTAVPLGILYSKYRKTQPGEEEGEAGKGGEEERNEE